MCVCGLYEGVWVSEWVNEIEWHRKNEISINLIFDIHIKRLLFQSSITVCDLVRRLKSINARAHRKHYDWHEIGTIPIYTDTEMTGHSEVKSTYNFQLWHTDSAFATILWLFVCEIRYNFSLSLSLFCPRLVCIRLFYPMAVLQLKKWAVIATAQRKKRIHRTIVRIVRGFSWYAYSILVVICSICFAVCSNICVHSFIHSASHSINPSKSMTHTQQQQ